jgi:hypothetical protein
MTGYLGEIEGILAAVCWTATSMAFESAGKKVESLAVNLNCGNINGNSACADYSPFGYLIQRKSKL